MNLTKILAVIGLMLGTAFSATAADRVLIIGVEHYRDEKRCNAERNNLQEGCVTPTYGGVADALAMEKLVREKFGFPKNSIHTLTELRATAANIRDEFKNWIIRDTRPGDRVFVFYSGHGARVKDDGTDESTRNGYHVRAWAEGNVAFFTVSDSASVELDRFETLMSASEAAL